MATITYSTWTKGWTSFWSYVPDWMIGLNSSFYTFTEGKLYKHNDNTTRNNFYGVQYSSTVTTVFNDEPMQMKVFKTISEDSNKPWKATIDTELNTAEMDVSYFVEKEAEWFAYIRRVDNTIDLKAVSTQGIGNATSIDSSTASAVVVTFGFDLNKSISIGDKLYKMGVTGTNPPISDGTMVLIGTITGLTTTTITVDTTAGVVPLVTDFLIGVKNSQVESYGSRGFFMSVKLENTDTTQVEMFSIASSVFKSFP
jgi:hypothetical protein